MGDGSKGAVEDTGASKGTVGYAQGRIIGIDTIWEQNMGGNGHDDDSPGVFPPQDCNTYCRDGGAEGKWQGMIVGLGGRGAGGDRDFSNKGVRAEATGKN